MRRNHMRSAQAPARRHRARRHPRRQVQPEGLHRLPRQRSRPAALRRPRPTSASAATATRRCKIDCFECHASKPQPRLAPTQASNMKRDAVARHRPIDAARRGFLGVAAAGDGRRDAGARHPADRDRAGRRAARRAAGANPKVRWGLLIDTDEVRQRLHRLRRAPATPRTAWSAGTRPTDRAVDPQDRDQGDQDRPHAPRCR